MLRRWLSRLAMSFIVLAAAFGWQAYRAEVRDGRTIAYAAGAAVCAGLGMAGIRERHRRESSEDIFKPGGDDVR